MSKIEELVKTIVSIFEEHAADNEVIFATHLTTLLTEGKHDIYICNAVSQFSQIAFGRITIEEEAANQIIAELEAMPNDREISFDELLEQICVIFGEDAVDYRPGTVALRWILC